MPSFEHRKNPGSVRSWAHGGTTAVSRRAVALWLLGGGAARAAFAAAPLPSPTGSVVLTVSGRIALPNAGADAKFDMTMLESFAAAQLRHPHAVVCGADEVHRPAAA